MSGSFVQWQHEGSKQLAILPQRWPWREIGFKWRKMVTARQNLTSFATRKMWHPPAEHSPPASMKPPMRSMRPGPACQTPGLRACRSPPLHEGRRNASDAGVITLQLESVTSGYHRWIVAAIVVNRTCRSCRRHCDRCTAAGSRVQVGSQEHDDCAKEGWQKGPGGAHV